jgi:hypothetical protein
MVIWYLLLFPETVGIDITNRRNVPEGFARINLNRTTGILGYTHLNVIYHRTVTEAEVYAWQ